MAWNFFSRYFPPPKPPARPPANITPAMISFLAMSGGADWAEIAANMAAVGLAGVPLVRNDYAASGDPWAFPTDQATINLAIALGGEPVFDAGPQSGTGPFNLYKFNRIKMPWKSALEIAAGAALYNIVRYGIASYRESLEATRKMLEPEE